MLIFRLADLDNLINTQTQINVFKEWSITVKQYAPKLCWALDGRIECNNSLIQVNVEKPMWVILSTLEVIII